MATAADGRINRGSCRAARPWSREAKTGRAANEHWRQRVPFPGAAQVPEGWKGWQTWPVVSVERSSPRQGHAAAEAAEKSGQVLFARA